MDVLVGRSQASGAGRTHVTSSDPKHSKTADGLPRATQREALRSVEASSVARDGVAEEPAVPIEVGPAAAQAGLGHDRQGDVPGAVVALPSCRQMLGGKLAGRRCAGSYGKCCVHGMGDSTLQCRRQCRCSKRQRQEGFALSHVIAAAVLYQGGTPRQELKGRDASQRARCRLLHATASSWGGDNRNLARWGERQASER